ncbi:MAG: S41 family peptidase [Rikenellaceae bacterium]|nr:S41 family peptidase [Rikenellaceae bacterium]
MRFSTVALAAALACLSLSARGQNSRRADFDAGKNIEIFFNIYRGVNTQYVDSVDNKKLIETAAAKMLSSLDPYTEYFNEEQMKEFRVHTTGRYGGVGAIVRKDSDADYVRIAEPYKNSPADRAGLRAGDLVAAIDGVSMKGVAVDSVSARMKGMPGSSFTMTVRDRVSGKEHDVQIKRERIKIPAVTYAGFINDSVGYVALESFSDDCAMDVRRHIMEMKNTGRLKGLVLDLRGNGGGLLMEAVALTGLFVPKGTEVVSIKGRVKSENAVYKTTNDPIDTRMPLVVMVNSSSASSSEIVAGALQDLDRAVIYGTRTFGKGLVQSTIGVGYGSYIKLTTAKYYIPSGRCIQAVDYSHRNEDGSVGHIPDSLMKEFKTLAGRTVRDGGGITPDVVIKPEYANKFALALMAYGYIDDYAIEYCSTRRDASFDPLTFRLADSDYADFCRFIEGKELKYTSATQMELNKLKSIAEKEDYHARLSPLIEQMEELVRTDKKRDLELYKDEIVEYIESAITANYAYAWGRAQRAVAQDTSITDAARHINLGLGLD